MSIKIINTTDAQARPKVIMCVYGNGGVGKTTFASTAPKPLLVDCENGSKYFGLRGIKMDVAKINEWGDMQGLFEVAKSGQYETIILDPIGELMEKLKRYMISKGDKKNVMADGSPTMAGWGWLKDTMRSTLKILRDSGVHLILVAHVDEKEIEGQLIKRPKVMTKLSEEIIALVDIVGYMEVVMVEGDAKRIIRVQPSEKYEAKDRTNQLGGIIPPDFSQIIEACQGTKTFKWSKSQEKNETVNDAAEDIGASKKDSMNEKLGKAAKKSK